MIQRRFLPLLETPEEGSRPQAWPRSGLPQLWSSQAQLFRRPGPRGRTVAIHKDNAQGEVLQLWIPVSFQ